MFPSLEITESTLGKSVKLKNLYVCWVFIAFITCSLDFLHDPFLMVINVGRIKGAKCPFDLQFLTWDFS